MPTDVRSEFRRLLKMFISYFQIGGGLAFAFDLNFPPIFASAMDFLSGIVNVNFISLMPLGCVLPSNYHKALLGYTLFRSSSVSR